MSIEAVNTCQLYLDLRCPRDMQGVREVRRHQVLWTSILRTVGPLRLDVQRRLSR